MSAVLQTRSELGVARAKLRARAVAEPQLGADMVATKVTPYVARLIGFAMLLTAAAFVALGSVGL
jgi:hypothetical protein